MYPIKNISNENKQCIHISLYHEPPSTQLLTTKVLKMKHKDFNEKTKNEKKKI